MPTSLPLLNRYLSWRKRPTGIARWLSGLVQTVAVFLWSSVTIGTGMMAHLDFDLRDQLAMHMQDTVVFLGFALPVALIVPTRSHLRFVLQSLAIGFSATLAYLATAAFNPM